MNRSTNKLKSNNSKNFILFSDHDCGTGKTFHALKRAVDQKTNTVFTFPTLHNLQNAHEDLIKKILPVNTTTKIIQIHSKALGNESSVTKSFVNEAKKLLSDWQSEFHDPDDHVIILCTHAGLFESFPKDLLDTLTSKLSMNLVIDEVPKDQISDYVSLQIPTHRCLVRDLITAKKISKDSTAYLLSIKDHGAVQAFLSSPSDEMTEPLKVILRKIAEPFRRVITDAMSWDRIINQDTIDSSKTVDGSSPERQFVKTPENTLHFISTLNPCDVFTGFESITLLSADLPSSMQRELLEGLHGVSFVKDRKLARMIDDGIKERRRNDEVAIVDQKKIEIIVTDTHHRLSKSRLEKDDHLEQMLKACKEHMEKHFPDHKFLNVKNKDHEDHFISDFNVKNIGPYSYGINDWQDDFDGLIFSGAFNKTPKHYSMLMNNAFVSAEAIDAEIDNVLIQNLLRTRVRKGVAYDPEKGKDYVYPVYVGSPDVASRVKRILNNRYGFSDVKISFTDPVLDQLDADEISGIVEEGRSLKEMRDQKSADQRLTRKIEKIKAKKSSQILYTDTVGTFFGGAAQPIKIFDQVFQTHPEHVLSHDDSPVTTPYEIVKTFKSLFVNNLISDKMENHLFSCAVFDENGRGKDNIVGMHPFTVLDFDSTHLDPRDALNIIQRNSLFSIGYSTYSNLSVLNDESGVFSYRLIIFFESKTDGSLYTVDEWHAANDLILEMFKTAGYYTFDRAKMRKNTSPDDYATYCARKANNFKGLTSIDVGKLKDPSAIYFVPATVRDRKKEDGFFMSTHNNSYTVIKYNPSKTLSYGLIQQKADENRELKEREAQERARKEEERRQRAILADTSHPDRDVPFVETAFFKKNVKETLDKMGPKHRSSPACYLAGLVGAAVSSGRLASRHRHEARELLFATGIDRSAQKSVDKYLRM